MSNRQRYMKVARFKLFVTEKSGNGSYAAYNN